MTGASNAVDFAARGADQTRLRILAATRELFAARGTKGTTTREVADRAGVNEATLFRHFGTKQQLVDAMLEYYGKLDQPWRSLGFLNDIPTIEAKLCALLTAAIDAMVRKQDLIRMTMAEDGTNPEGNSSAWRAPSEARTLLVSFFSVQTRAGTLRGDPELLARAFISLSFAYVMARKIWGDYDRPVEYAVDHMVALFLNGARA